MIYTDYFTHPGMYMGHQTVKQTLYYFHFVPDFYPSYRALAESSDDILPEVPQ